MQNHRINQILHGGLSYYRIEDFIGRGAYGVVTKCQNVDTGENFAVKISKPGMKELAKKEAAILKFLQRHDSEENHIVKLVEDFTNGNYFYLVFELLHENLHSHIRDNNKKGLSLVSVRKIAAQILKALSFLESVGITHADIKPNNIMLKDNNSVEIKLIDFGLAVATTSLNKKSSLANTRFRAPEVSLGLERNQSVDMWALGCSLFFLYFGELLFPGCEFQLIRGVVKLFGPLDKDFLISGTRTELFFSRTNVAGQEIFEVRKNVECGSTWMHLSSEHDGVHGYLRSLDEMKHYPKPLKGRLEAMDLENFIDLLKKMLDPYPSRRISPKDALNHQFITKQHYVDLDKEISNLTDKMAMLTLTDKSNHM